MKNYILLIIALCSLFITNVKAEITSKDFPIGVYGADPRTPYTFKFLKSLGINYVQSYVTGRNTPKNDKTTQKFLDLATEYDFKVMFHLHARIWAHKENGVEELRKLVRRFKDHPAIGFWHVYDEPRIEVLPKLKKIYAMLKEEAPNIPVTIVAAQRKKWYKLREAVDVLLIDRYPIKEKPFPESNAGSLTNFTIKAIKWIKKPIIPVMQAFNQEMFDKKKNIDVSNYRFPNKDEVRYWAFSSLSMGVGGLFYYSYYNARYKNKNGAQWYKDVLGEVIKETRNFIAQTDTKHKPTKKIYLEEQNLILGIWRGKQKSYIVISNYSKEENTVKQINLKAPIKNTNTIVSWGNSRQVTAKINARKLTINEKLKPWEVIILKVVTAK